MRDRSFGSDLLILEVPSYRLITRAFDLVIIAFGSRKT